MRSQNMYYVHVKKVLFKMSRVYIVDTMVELCGKISPDHTETLKYKNHLRVRHILLILSL